LEGLEPPFRPAVERPNKFQHIPAEWEASGTVEPGSLILYGSSIMRRWKEAEADWDPLPTYNRGFGGSRTWEAVEYLNIILSYRPRVIVFYCGTNDVTFHEERGTPQEEALNEIIDNITIILRTTEATGIQMILGSLIRSPQKREKSWMLDLVDKANKKLIELCEEHPHAEFVDINPLVEDEHGNPIASLYEPDGLHYRRSGYVRVAAALKEPVYRRWEKQTRRPTKRHSRQRVVAKL